jgi:SAM-dependent methyltransferase
MMLESLSACPICKAHNVGVKYNDVCDYLNGDVEKFTISTCFDCDHTYLSLRPYSYDIDKYYKAGYYTHKNSKGISFYFGRCRAWLKSKFIKRKVSRPFGSGAFLDIGCGSGVHLGDYEKNGWKVHGLEVDRTALGVAMRNNPSCEFESDPFNEESFGDLEFDLVNMSHVLEHIYDLHEFMDVLVKKTSNKAKVIIAVPRFESLERKIFGKYWRGLEVPRHLHHFNQESLISLLEGYSFKCESCDPQSLPMCFAESLYFCLRYCLGLKILPKNTFVNCIYYLSYLPYKVASKLWPSNAMILTFGKSND